MIAHLLPKKQICDIVRSSMNAMKVGKPMAKSHISLRVLKVITGRSLMKAITVGNL